jgi:transporter family-2 protein
MSLLYYIISFVAGMSITLQAGANGLLREKVGSPIFSTLINFTIGTLSLAAVFCYCLASGSYSFSGENTIKGIHWWMLTGGLFGAFYIFTTIFATPKIGFANMFSLVICGQIILTVIFDHFGVLGLVHTVNPIRAAGIVLLVSGAYLIQKY